MSNKQQIQRQTQQRYYTGKAIVVKPYRASGLGGTVVGLIVMAITVVIFAYTVLWR